MFTNRRARKENAAAMYYKNKLYEQFLPRNGAVPTLVNVESVNAETDVPVTTAIYVDFLRPDVYTETGTRKYPFKTLAAAYALAADGTGQKTIVLLSGNVNAENVTFSKGRVFLVGENSSGTHAPLIFTGSLTFTGQSASISDNRFSVSGTHRCFWDDCYHLFGIKSTAFIFERCVDYCQWNITWNKYDKCGSRFHASHQ